MGRYIEQNDSQTEYQKRLAADLQAKAIAKMQASDAEAPDGVEDAAYIKGTKATTGLAPVWGVVFLLAIAAFIFFVVRVNG